MLEGILRYFRKIKHCKKCGGIIDPLNVWFICGICYTLAELEDTQQNITTVRKN